MRRVPSPKCFAQPGDRHRCQASNTGSALEKRKELLKNTRGRSWSSQKILVVVVGVRKNCPVTEQSFQKDLQDIFETKGTRAWTFGAKSFQSAGNKKKLFKTNVTLERKEMISSFEQKSS